MADDVKMPNSQLGCALLVVVVGHPVRAALPPPLSHVCLATEQLGCFHDSWDRTFPVCVSEGKAAHTPCQDHATAGDAVQMLLELPSDPQRSPNQ